MHSISKENTFGCLFNFSSLKPLVFILFFLLLLVISQWHFVKVTFYHVFLILFFN